jgi:2,3-dihydroxyethylbenzene 1,2-dioxygenase
MTQVTELGYLKLGVKRLARWREFAGDILGLEVVDGDLPGRAFLRMDYWHHRIVLEENDMDDLMLLGFRVAGQDEFGEMAKRLRDAGIAVRVGSFEEAAERHVLEVMMLEDPSGTPIEIFHGPHVQADLPFRPGRRMHGPFKTGSGGLGHVMIGNPAGYDEAYAFYRLLGMRGGVEYRIPVPDLPRPFDLTFMHCNDRDHTLALTAPGAKRINHLMFEVESFDDVGLAYETVKLAGIPVGIEPGRHANDQMYSFYFINPSGFMSEIGWGARKSSHQSEYYQRDTFGHETVAGVVSPGMEVEAALEPV